MRVYNLHLLSKKWGMKMKVKGAILTVLLVVMGALLSGCWNQRELNKIAIVMAMGVDKVEQTDNYRVSFQVVNPGAVASGQTGGGAGAGEMPVTVFTSTGRTLLEAIRKSSQRVPRELFFSHMQLLPATTTIVGKARACAHNKGRKPIQ